MESISAIEITLVHISAKVNIAIQEMLEIHTPIREHNEGGREKLLHTKLNPKIYPCCNKC